MNETSGVQISSMNFGVVPNVVKIVPSVVEKRNTGKKWVFWGDNNNFPNYLWELYLKSSVLQGVVNGTADFISGNGIINNFYEGAINDDGDTLEDVIRKITFDYNIFGGFALEVIRNVKGDISSINWLDIRNVRVDKDGIYAYYSNKWCEYGEKPIQLELWDPNKKQKQFIVFYKGHITRGVYPIPRYIGALGAIETSAEIGKYHLNNILNNLSASCIVNFNNGEPSAAEKKIIEKKLNEKFAGSNNAGRMLISFNNNKDEAATIEGLPEDNSNDKFNTLSKSIREEIFIAHRAYPVLFGLPEDNRGFSRTEFLEAFELYNKTVVKPMQNDIERLFNKLFEREVVKFNTFTLGDEKNNVIE